MQGIFCAAVIPHGCLLIFNETFYNSQYPVDEMGASRAVEGRAMVVGQAPCTVFY